MASHSSSPSAPGQAPSAGGRQAAGALAEDAAARYLEGRGLRVAARNFRVRGGEIDLICRDGDAIVFVEVRSRSQAGYGGAAASITARKQARVVLAARHWLAAHPAEARRPCRFDCVCLDGGRLEWLRDAFAAD
ncbi:MAG: YraN family protein [Rhodocyclaceae bacterium]|nr:YraN family protein [Rhodocyclaceae bacterium]